MGRYPKPNKAEAERIERMLKLGCIACSELCLWMTAEVHHIVEGKKRLGHWYTLPLCPGHHRNIWLPEQLEAIPKDMICSLAHGSKQFLLHYSSEREMWERVQKRLKLSLAWPASKVLPRKGMASANTSMPDAVKES